MVEMLMYMGLLSLLLVVMVDLFVSSLNAQLESQATSGVDQDTKFILSRLSSDIRASDTISLPGFGATPSGMLSLVTSGITHTYATQSGKIIYTTQSQSDSLNSFESTTEDVTFQRLGNNNGKNAIKIMFTIKSKTTRSSGPEIRRIETTVGTR